MRRASSWALSRQVTRALRSSRVTSYPREEPYALDDLAAVIPKGWRVPRPATTVEGRNVELFLVLCKRGLRDTDRQLEAFADTYNDAFVPPMDAAEVRGILKSVLRYRDRWREHGHQQSFLFRQALRGRKGGAASGKTRLANVSDRDHFIVARLDAGESQRAVARAFGVSIGTVHSARARLTKQGVQRSQYR